MKKIMMKIIMKKFIKMILWLISYKIILFLMILGLEAQQRFDRGLGKEYVDKRAKEEKVNKIK